MIQPEFNPDTAKCEHCNNNLVWRFSETVRDRRTGVAKILNICRPCYQKLTGAK